MMTQHPSLLDTDQELLELLSEESRQTPNMLLNSVESTESKQYVQNRLKHLRDNDLVERADRGIYELTTLGERAADNLDMYREDRGGFWRLLQG
ncbi:MULTISPECIES: hypothetical protein [Halorussus]|uniref:hypothetical protein n=1 Tax=Halorussus TaxID=1070314 RepID=UPI0013B3806E|nr:MULTISPECIES: hypothetical protein [Halorussus]NHN60027.1 hypothetical protein [Halorussus sp. JP-T4]